MLVRTFLKVLGGAIILPATAALPGCSSAIPTEATISWRGPGAETDVRRWVLSYALLAPHSHNLQSWIADIRQPEEIVLRCDPSRLLPQTDPYSRQIMMSHGTFLELLDLAARERGFKADIELFPEGSVDAERLDARPVGVAMQPLQQALQEYPEQQANHQAIRQNCGATHLGQTVQMWARVGYAPEVPAAPRRPLVDILRA